MHRKKIERKEMPSSLQKLEETATTRLTILLFSCKKDTHSLSLHSLHGGKNCGVTVDAFNSKTGTTTALEETETVTDSPTSLRLK